MQLEELPFASSLKMIERLRQFRHNQEHLPDFRGPYSVNCDASYYVFLESNELRTVELFFQVF